MIVGTVCQTEINCRPGVAQEREKATAHGRR